MNNNQKLDEACAVAHAISHLDQVFLKERFCDGLSPATRTHALVLPLHQDLTAHLVHPNMKAGLLDDAQELVGRLFPESWAAHWRATMDGIVSRIPLRTIIEPQEVDYAITYERSAYFVYERHDAVVATAGFYQDLKKSDSCYGGLFGVDKPYWGSSIVPSVLKHILETVRDYQHATELEIFTSDADTNKRVQQLYEGLGFASLEDTFLFRGELQRRYVLNINRFAPVWARLSSIEERLVQRDKKRTERA